MDQAVWERVVEAAERRIAAGHDHLLNEAVVRDMLVNALIEGGHAPARLVTEYRGYGFGPIDLVIDAPHGVAIEIKFPREPHQTSPPTTDHFGELLNDFVRLSRASARQRFALILLKPWMLGYLNRRTDVRLTPECGARLDFSDAEIATLPRSARGKIKAGDRGVRVRAGCVFARSLPDVRLAVWEVEPAESAAGGTTTTP